MENKWISGIKKTDARTNEARNYVKHLFLRELKNYGYSEIDLPTLNYSEFFIINNDYSSAQNHFKTIAPNGEVLAIGDDLIKGLISYSREMLVGQGKLCSYMDVYSFLNTEKRDGFQVCGLHFGAEGVEAESDAIAASYDFARRLGVDAPRVKIGHTDVFRGVLNSFSGKNETLSRLKDILKGNLSCEADYATSQTLASVKNIEGKPAIIKDLAAKLDNQCSLDGLLDLFEVTNVLEVYEMDRSVSILPGYLGENEYDNGIVFVVEDAQGTPLVRGGRCDCVKGNETVKCVYLSLCTEEAVATAKAFGLSKTMEEKSATICVAETRTALQKARKIRKDLMEEGIMTDVYYNATEKQIYAFVEKHRDGVVIYIDEEGNITHS